MTLYLAQTLLAMWTEINQKTKAEMHPVITMTINAGIQSMLKRAQPIVATSAPIAKNGIGVCRSRLEQIAVTMAAGRNEKSPINDPKKDTRNNMLSGSSSKSANIAGPPAAVTNTKLASIEATARPIRKKATWNNVVVSAPDHLPLVIVVIFSRYRLHMAR
ncbi:hypothetical protein [Phyllobacterium zundukense]|uniref:hypothetical protein n=1 Tax=Phyllobacterium zundukense TaxID=1867719 RepID=UPI001055184E|nr:hypothetical protein [Phyllobacterium zundukense]